MRRRVLASLVLAMALGAATPALAWSNGSIASAGFGSHDWMLHEGKRLAGDPSWLNLGYALPLTDNPDTISRDYHNHAYDRWGLVYYGNAPKKIEAYYNKAVIAYKYGDFVAASRYVGLMSHYYTDCVNPLHTDGSRAEVGMHRVWERAVDTRLDSPGENRWWLAYDGYQYFSSVETKSISGARYAHQYYGALVRSYNGYSYNSTVDAITRRCVNKATNGLADIIRQIPRGQLSGVSPSGATTTTTH